MKTRAAVAYEVNAPWQVEEFEINEAQKASPVRNAEARRRQEERLEQDMASYMERLRSLVDDDGMEWLRSQTTG